MPNSRGTLDLLGQQTVGSYQLLPNNKFGLQDELNKLNNDSSYHVLLNISWAQPMASSSGAKWIHIYGGQPYDQTGRPISNYGLTQTATTTLSPQQPQTVPSYWEINGRIKVSFQSYYQIYTRLYLTEPESIIGGQADSNAIGSFQPIP